MHGCAAPDSAGIRARPLSQRGSGRAQRHNRSPGVHRSGAQNNDEAAAPEPAEFELIGARRNVVRRFVLGHRVGRGRVAEVNLKLIWDVVSQIKVGERGHAFVVDAQGG